MPETLDPVVIESGATDEVYETPPSTTPSSTTPSSYATPRSTPPPPNHLLTFTPITPADTMVHDNADDDDRSTIGEMITELSRKVSVEAAVGPMALYPARSRSASVSSRRSAGRGRAGSVGVSTSVSFPETVVEHEKQRAELREQMRRPSRAAAMGDRPMLPRIDSEKTLAMSDVIDDDDDEVDQGPLRRLAKYKSTGSDEAAAAVEQPSKESSDVEAASDVEDEQAEAARKMSKARKILLGTVMMLEVFVSSMSSNAVVLTIPTMAKDLGVSQLEAQWVSSAYSLSFGCGLLFAGRLADIYGRKMLFLGGLAAAAIFCIISGVVRSFIPLCVIRALAGLGLAVATPAGFGIIGVTFRDEPERTIAYACFGLGNPLGSSVGMLVGGGVAGINARGWQYLYFVLGGLAIVPLLIGIWVIPRDPTNKLVKDKRIDWLGGFLITAALCLFTFSITDSGIAPDGWRTPYVPALLAVSIILFGAFGWWERRVERNASVPPIAKLSIFSRDGWKISIIMLCTFSVFVCIAGWVYLVSLFYQEHKGMSPIQNAIHVLPAALCGTVAAAAVMVIVPRVRAPIVLAVGGFLSGLACLLFAVIPDGTSYWASGFISMLLLPFGADLTVGIGSILMSNLCDDDEQSVAGALFQTAIQIASALGICISSLVSNDVYLKTGDYLTGLRHAFGMTTAWAFGTVFLAGIFLRKMGLAKHVGNGRAVH